MTKGQESPSGGVARTVENRSHARRKLTTMAYVELGQENGGILLNLGEGGLAVQSALTLWGREFPDMRFQLPNSKRWLVARGRVTWLSESHTEAGIQFLDLRPEMQAQIRRWVALAGESSKLTATQTANPTDSQRIRHPQGNGGNLSGAATLAATTAIGEGSVAAQNFRFNDYSMFSGEGNAEQVSIEPLRSRWKSFALLAMSLAILFFVLGASVGRYTFDQWLQPRAPERQTPAVPAAPDAGANSAEQGPQDQPNASERPNIPAPVPERAAESTAGQNGTQGRDPWVTAANSEANRSNQSDPANGVKAPEAPAKSSDNIATDRMPEAAEAKLKSSPHSLQPLRPTPPTYRDAATRTDDDAHSILVSAPAPGSPAFLVNLTNEAVDASPWVAISTARSIWIGPKSNQDGSNRAERVTIGRLISHTQPFYPQEARNQHLEGSVVLRATFGPTGTLLKVTPVSGPSLLETAGMAAVREWRYAPTFIDGDPVETQAEITMVFRLR